MASPPPVPPPPAAAVGASSSTSSVADCELCAASASRAAQFLRHTQKVVSSLGVKAEEAAISAEASSDAGQIARKAVGGIGVLRQPTGPGYTTATTLDRGVAAMRGFNATLVQGTLHLSVNEHCAVAVGATKEALEASKAVLLAALGAVKAAEEAVAAAAEADFCAKAAWTGYCGGQWTVV